MKIFLLVITSVITLLFSLNTCNAQCFTLSTYTSHPLCYNDNNSFIDFSINNSSLPIIYSWNGPESGIDTIFSTSFQSNLPPGCYQVTIEDAVGCDTMFTTCINPRPDTLIGHYQISNDTISFDSITGGIVITSSNPYNQYYIVVLVDAGPLNSYTVDTGTTFPFIITNLPTTTYYLAIVDPFNCQTFDTIQPNTVNINSIENNSPNVAIFPNPFHDEIKLNTPNNVFHTLILQSISGVTYYSTTLDNTTLAIETNSLPQGMYILTLVGDRKIVSKKIIKTNL